MKLMPQTKIMSGMGFAFAFLLAAAGFSWYPASPTIIVVNGLGILLLASLMLFVIKRESALRERAERERDRLFDFALDMYCIAGFDGYFKQVNPAWEKTLGWSNAELLASPFIEFVHPDDRESTTHAVGTLVDGKEVYSFENRYRCKDGSYKWLAWVSHPLSEEGLIFALARDVTEHKRQDEALRLATEKAQELDRIKSEFLASMSHELRTPLSSIIGFSEMIRDGLAGELTPKQKEYIEDIFQSGVHLLSLINDILDLSKIEAGKMILEPEPVSLPSLLEDCLTVVKEKAAAHRIRLSLEIDPEIGGAQLDARKFKQIVYNYLSNAVKFTPDGGWVVVSARLAPAAALPATAKPHVAAERYLEVAVTDSGIGIAQQDLPHLFQSFVQIDSGLNRKFEGTGLGLSLVEKLVDLFGGAVGVKSEPGKGSCFSVWLPWEPSL